MKLIKFDNKGLEFDNGTTISDYHYQECCEHVYADWEQLKDTDVLQHEFKDEIEIEKVENSGFRIEGYFIPCYNDQNGYYSGELSLIINYKKEVNLDSCTENV